MVQGHGSALSARMWSQMLQQTQCAWHLATAPPCFTEVQPAICTPGFSELMLDVLLRHAIFVGMEHALPKVLARAIRYCSGVLLPQPQFLSI